MVGGGSPQHALLARNAPITTDHRYEIVNYWSEPDHAFVAEVPERAGCMADGTTYGDALRNVETTISAWIETARELGREIPKPKGRLLHA